MKLASGDLFEVEIEMLDLVDDLKRKIFEMKGIDPDRQILIHGGKALRDDLPLSYFTSIRANSTLGLIERPRRRSAEARATTSVEQWKETAAKYNFDDDLHIVDPQAYYSRLDSLERYVVLQSEYFRCKGSYNALNNGVFIKRRTRETPPSPLGFDVDATLDLNWGTQSVSSANLFRESESFPETDEMEIKQVLDSLRNSLMVLKSVIQRFDHLVNCGFATTYFSFLSARPKHNLAEIVPISRDNLAGLASGIDYVISEISSKATATSSSVQSCLERSISTSLNRLLEPFDDTVFPPDSFTKQTGLPILEICRMTVLFLDLALVCYVGSHGSRFDEEYLHVRTPTRGITVNSTHSKSFSFQCTIRCLACLNGFLDHKRVWVFEFIHGCGETATTALKRLGHLDSLSILTRMEHFADIWGPIWAIPTVDEKGDNRIRQYNVSKGVIRGMNSTSGMGSTYKNAVRCHWESWPSYYRKRFSRLFSPSDGPPLLKDDLLLIGEESRRFLRVNTDCNYTLNDFEATYGDMMRVLGPRPSSWITDNRSLGVSLSRIVGISVTGTQKKIPATTLKQHLLDKWMHNPTRANPWIFQQYLGVEISHCTGNARRVPLKDFLLRKSMKPLLERQFPGWESTPWGSSLIMALLNPNMEAIFKFWGDHNEERSQVAELLCSILELLNDTGMTDLGFTTAFLSSTEERSISLDPNKNHWTRLLADSPQMAVYSLVTDTCLECQTPDHTTTSCSTTQTSPAYTVLETQIAIQAEETRGSTTISISPPRTHSNRIPTVAELHRIKLSPTNLILERVNKENFSMILLCPNKLSVSLWYRRLDTGVETRDRGNSRSRFMVFVRAKTSSNGGMTLPRQNSRVPPNVQPEEDLEQAGQNAGIDVGHFRFPNTRDTHDYIAPNGIFHQLPPRILADPLSYGLHDYSNDEDDAEDEVAELARVPERHQISSNERSTNAEAAEISRFHHGSQREWDTGIQSGIQMDGFRGNMDDGPLADVFSNEEQYSQAIVTVRRLRRVSRFEQ